MTLSAFLICLFGAIILGVLNALLLSFRGRISGTLAYSLAVLPPVITLIIMLVNGNIGAGLGVAGAFSLVRFRSQPGSARDILGIFISTAIGLACGMGFVGIAALFFIILAAFMTVLSLCRFGEASSSYRKLKIVIPENLDYDGLFDDLFEKYTSRSELVKVKTTNMGTLYELTYDINLKGSQLNKQFLDDIRCRNGNLNVTCSKASESSDTI